MFEVVFLDSFLSDYLAAEQIITDYYAERQLYEKIEPSLLLLKSEIKSVQTALEEAPDRYSVHLFEPSIQTTHEYHSKTVLWFTMFWWIDEEEGICYLYRMLNSRSDLPRSSSW